MKYAEIGNPGQQLGPCIADTSDEYGVYDPSVCCLVLWIYSSCHNLEVKKGRTHSRLNKGEGEWKGTPSELGRGKFDFDMSFGSITFVQDTNILIQRVIIDDLRSRFKESVFYVFDAPSNTCGSGVLLEEFMNE